MASLKDIQRQIKSVKNTEKTTKAMKLVSIAKFKKVEALQKNSKDYAKTLEVMSSELSNACGDIDLELVPCFRVSDEIKIVDIIFVTADKGLCGSFNSSTLKEVKKLMKEYKDKGITVRLRGLGKKGIDFFKFNGVNLEEQMVNTSSFPDYENSYHLIEDVIKDYENAVTDEVVVVYNSFKSHIATEVIAQKIFPLKAASVHLDIKRKSYKSEIDVESSNDEKLLNHFIETYLKYNFYYILINSLAAEHSSRMQAMDASSKSAGEMIQSLQLTYNKLRQEAITNELIEIISGVESIK